MTSIYIGSRSANNLRKLRAWSCRKSSFESSPRWWVFSNQEKLILVNAVVQASKEHLEKHYADLSKKPFFAGLVSYMASGPVVAMVWEGLNAVKTGNVQSISIEGWDCREFNFILSLSWDRLSVESGRFLIEMDSLEGFLNLLTSSFSSSQNV